MVVADDVPIETFEGISFPGPASVALELRRADQMLAVNGSIDARACGPCVACLEEVDRQIHVDVAERLDPAHGRDDDPFGESNVFQGQRLDVADLAAQMVLSALPMGLRCKEDCLGLCAVCGANRNMGECSCDRV